MRIEVGGRLNRAEHVGVSFLAAEAITHGEAARTCTLARKGILSEDDPAASHAASSAIMPPAVLLIRIW